VHYTPKTGLRTALLIGTVALVTFNVAGSARADNVETVVVTGSRIPQANLQSVSPILGVSAKEIQQKGVTDVSDYLNDLPQTFVSNTGDFSNTNNPLSAPGGVTTVDLRGLGAERTLVLVNGRRLGVGDPNTGNPGAAPDIDQIPVPLIDHVEVLTGGASATYGSDAIAGVVNFIMKKDFEGIQVDGLFGGDWHDNANSFARGLESKAQAAGVIGPIKLAPSTVFDGKNNSESVIIGANSPDGKGNVTGYIVYRNADPVFQRNRDFSECQINITSKAACAGSSNSNLFQPFGSGPAFDIVGDQALPRPQLNAQPPATFNANQFEDLSRQDSRYSGGFFAHYDVNSWVKPYTEFSFMDDRSRTEIAPDAVFQFANAFAPDGSGLYFVNCDNPLLSAQEVQVFCTSQGLAGNQNTELNIGRRNIEGGPRISNYEHINYRGVVGVQGDIDDAWHYDVYGSYYYVSLYQANSGYFSNTKVNNALQVVSVNGVPTCANVAAGTNDGCVPYNIFKTGGVTKAALDYLTEIGTSHGTTQEEILEADVTGNLGKYGIQSPWAADGVQLSLGATNRKDKLVFQADQAEQSGDLLGFGGAAVPINNAINVAEYYGEFRAPLIQNAPFAEDVELEGGIRFSSYSNKRKPTTFKAGLAWSPTSDIRFRASYDLAIRAASILESFTPNTVTNTSLVSVDPCAPTLDANNNLVPATATFAQCQRTGVTAAQYGNGGTTDTIPQCVAGQCSIELGGNNTLTPEKAKTFSVGFTATPSFLDGFVASVDYFKIDLTNVIVQGIPPAQSLSTCLATGDPTFCSKIVRNSLGGLNGATAAGGGFVDARFVNLASSSLSGVDFQGDYHADMSDLGMPSYGSIAFRLVGTLTSTSKSINFPGNPATDCSGLFGNTCGSPLPKWRHQFRITWESLWDVTLSAQWRFLSGVKLDTNTSQPGLSNGKFDKLNATIPDTSYLDLSGSWQFDEHLEIRAGIDNVFDTDPKIISNLITGSGTPNVYNTYDELGRNVYIAGTVKF